MEDIYFNLNYGKLYEKIENGVACIWEYKGEEGHIKHMFIKRAIPQLVYGTRYYDLITPYGYGGPYIVSISTGYSKEMLLNAFENSFQKYCEDENIVSEFIRFYPLSSNGVDFQRIYNSILNRYTLGTNLKDYEDPIQMEFSKSCRKTIRQIIKKGVTYRATRSPQDISKFIEIYYLNMERKCADTYYFFEKDYFEKIMEYFSENVLLAEAIYCNKTIAAGLYFLSNNVIHAHLSGTDTEYLDLSPAYILKYGTVLWGKENQFDFIHYGGGTTCSKEDPLFTFKKKFSQNTELPFYIGKKIWNKNIYEVLCKDINVDENSDFFPLYRKK
ncbi:GNAT family N-acetyltransferase [uncultured Fusobacterium sp.]|uniref:GNAT family N-acetyltransferase n=1 Tax=uncultured Fusobacterium sp. TaxID=159267 RepID=UPI00265EB082|nr:GNAT family N-acetyltransferase [uncultured Fusobacterium sp.]